VASNYPGSLDSFDMIASDKKTSDAVGGRTHRDMHNDLGDAIESVQGELGTDPSGSYATVKARFEAIEGSTLPQVDAKGDLIVGTADNTYDNLGVGTNDTVLLAASGETKGVKWAQVPTAAIQDGAVTSAKLATSGRFVFPTGAANGFGFTSGASHLSGTGSPEGVVTATPGSTWLQTDATTDVKGWIRWVKATGTGNTGWVAGPEADTGVRNISYTSGLANWTAGTLRLRRMGNIVSVRADGVGMAALATIYNLPTGFRASPFGEVIGTVMREGATTGNPYWMAIALANVVHYGAALSGTFSASYRFYGEWVFQTADAWPSTLP
jgi:hypothetical protein